MREFTIYSVSALVLLCALMGIDQHYTKQKLAKARTPQEGKHIVGRFSFRSYCLLAVWLVFTVWCMMRGTAA